MTVGAVLQAFRARWLLGFTCVVIGLLGATIVSVLVTPTYSATSSLYVSSQLSGDNLNAAYQGSLLGEQRIKSYTELASSVRVGEAIVQRTGLPLTPLDVSRMITAESPLDTVVLSISARADSPERAALISNAASDVLVGLVADLERPSDPARPPAVVLRVLETAVPPTSPVSPNYVVNLAIGLLVGLAVGVAAVVLVEQMDNTVRLSESMGEALGGVALGSIEDDDGLRSAKFTAAGALHWGSAEAIKQVRTNLQFANVDGKVQTLLVTSPTMGDGKTTVSALLAAAHSALGLKVLLVDTDLRRPRLADYLNLEAAVGLTDVLVQRASAVDVIQRPEAGAFDVIVAGRQPPNPSEVLASRRMDDVLSDFRERYDLVILDSPPLLPVADSAILAEKADGVLVVARYAKTTVPHLEAARATLSAASARLLGGVLTGAPRSSAQAPYGGYYKYQSQNPSEATTVTIGSLSQDAVRPGSSGGVSRPAVSRRQFQPSPSRRDW